MNSDRVFSLAADPCLADHALEGTPLAPFALLAGELAAFAEAAALEDFAIALPVLLRRGRDKAVHLIREGGRAAMTDAAGTTLCSAGIAAAASAKSCGRHLPGTPQPPASASANGTAPVDPGPAGNLALGQRLYGPLFFHGPAFRAAWSLHAADRRTLAATLAGADPDDPAFARYAWNARFPLLLVDLALQAAALHLALADRRYALPAACARLATYPGGPGPFTVRAERTATPDGSCGGRVSGAPAVLPSAESGGGNYALRLTDAAGRLRVAIDGLAFRPVERPLAPDTASLLDALTESEVVRMDPLEIADEALATERLYEPPPESDDLFAKARHFYGPLARIREMGHYLFRRPLASANRAHVRMFDPATRKERDAILFASNNYLGLAADPRVVEASVKAAEKYGYGTGSVALFSGTTDLHLELEEKIARYYRCEACALFPTGYQANVGAIQALLHEGDAALADLYAHASIIDGVKLSGGTLKYFQHNDMASLERLLGKAGKHFRGKLIVTDGVFSMDGDIAPLDRIVALAAAHGARVLVDEAHAVGTVGPTGRGTAEIYGLEGKIDVTIGTLSKAPSGLGGYVAGCREMVEYVRHFGRAYIFSTSLPAPVVAGLLEVFRILETDPGPRERLAANVTYLRDGLHALGFDTLDSSTAIIPVVIADDLKLRAICRDLDAAGIYAAPVTFPAVAKGRSRIRVSVMATHSRADLDALLSNLKELKAKYGV